MKISLVIPTNRTSYSAVARVLECASLDPDKFQLIVRDNSESKDKERLLDEIKSPDMLRSTVPNRGGFENSIEALRQASGDYVLFLADDDWISTRGLRQLHSLAVESEGDSSVACLTGAYFVETATSTGFFQYSGLDSANAIDRVRSYLDANTSNYLFYSAIRRDRANFCFALMESLPYQFSYHDQFMSLLYLTLGRTLQINRVVYFYDLGDWESAGGSLGKDRASYLGAGLPIEYDRLHWLLCGLEGAYLLKSQLLAGKVQFDTVPLANLWFGTMFGRFKGADRELDYEETAVNAGTLKLKNKWISHSEIDLSELLLDVCDVFEIADKPGAERYFSFWSGL